MTERQDIKIMECARKEAFGILFGVTKSEEKRMKILLTDVSKRYKGKIELACVG